MSEGEDVEAENVILPWKHRDRCSLCGSKAGRTTLFETVVRFPDTPLANEYPRTANDAREQDKFPLALIMCQTCRHVQSSIIVDPDRLFRGYVYETSTSPLTIRHLKEEAAAICSKLQLLDKSRIKKPFVVEVGSNDGAFLKQMRSQGLGPDSLLGVDPAEEMAAVANKAGLQTMSTFFDEDVVRAILKNRGQADVVVANNVLAHVPDVKQVLRLIRSLLAPDGVLVMEVAHAVDVLSGAFDTIYHEHMSHHALVPLASCFDNIGMRLIDVEKDEGQVGRGSLRVYAARKDSRRKHDAESSSRCISLVDAETSRGALDLGSWQRELGAKVAETKSQLSAFYEKNKGSGAAAWRKTIAGYGAPAKLTTLAYACGIDEWDVAYVVDDSKWKQRLRVPGTGWPIAESSQLIKQPPDAIVIFAWNFADDIGRKLRAGGFTGPIAVPLPTWRLLP